MILTNSGAGNVKCPTEVYDIWESYLFGADDYMLDLEYTSPAYKIGGPLFQEAELEPVEESDLEPMEETDLTKY